MSDLVCLKSVSYPRALYDNKSHYRNEYQDVNPICYIAFCITVKSVLDKLWMVHFCCLLLLIAKLHIFRAKRGIIGKSCSKEIRDCKIIDKFHIGCGYFKY